MEVNLNFHPIEQSSWPMAQAFYYYTQMAPTTYTVNVDMGVTHLRSVLKEKGYKFFPAYLYLVTKTIGEIDALRVAKKDDILGHWEMLTPSYPQFHEETQTTSLLWTSYTERFQDFYDQYISDTTTFGKDQGILTKKGVPPANAYICSCIPWFTFNSFSLHNHGIKDYFVPSFEAGGFAKKEGKTVMPLSATVHHATTDGYHLKIFFERLQYLMDHPEEWL